MKYEKLKTYQQWNEKGRYIKRGEKASKFNEEGLALFSKSQTKRKEYRSLWDEHSSACTNYNQSKDWDYLDSAVLENY